MMLFHWCQMIWKEWKTEVMTDKTELIGNSVIQHGKENNRIYLMKLAQEDCPEIITYMENLALNESYTKILAKVPNKQKDFFLNSGYEFEARVCNFYNDEDDVYFLSKFLSPERKKFSNKNNVFKNIEFCMEKARLPNSKNLDKNFRINKLKEKDAPKMAEIFKSVFESYPFPIFDKDYIIKTMNENVDYFGVFEGKKLIAVSSSEMDLLNLNTEMTDFATLPQYRGKNFSYYLLQEMETAAKQKMLKTAYTIARSECTGINMTFAKMQYEYGGTLVNNTNICGNIETMNVWYKNL